MGGNNFISYKGKDNILFLEVFICFVILTQRFNFRLCFSEPLNVMDLIRTGRTVLVLFFDAFTLVVFFFFHGKRSEFMPVFL